MFDILLYIFENLAELSAQVDQSQLSRRLAAAGFAEEEVDEALVWLAQLNQIEVPDISTQKKSIRIYSSKELEQIGSQNIGFIQFLESVQAIDASTREFILNQVISMGNNIPLKHYQFKELLLIILSALKCEAGVGVVEHLIAQPPINSIH